MTTQAIHQAAKQWISAAGRQSVLLVSCNSLALKIPSLVGSLPQAAPVGSAAQLSTVGSVQLMSADCGELEFHTSQFKPRRHRVASGYPCPHPAEFSPIDWHHFGAHSLPCQHHVPDLRLEPAEGTGQVPSLSPAKKPPEFLGKANESPFLCSRLKFPLSEPLEIEERDPPTFFQPAPVGFSQLEMAYGGLSSDGNLCSLLHTAFQV